MPKLGVDEIVPVMVAVVTVVSMSLPTGRSWLGLGSNPGGSVSGVPDHA